VFVTNSPLAFHNFAFHTDKLHLFKTRKIIKKINRDFIGTDKIKHSLKEAIAFKQLKIEELMHNYLSDFIKERQLFVILEDVDRVNNLFV
jgi:hypothetical protein